METVIDAKHSFNHLVRQLTRVNTLRIEPQSILESSSTNSYLNRLLLGSMESLPCEIQAAILSLAFGDGGPTACALRQVSRLFLVITTPFRFYSIAITCSSTICKLLTQMDLLAPEHCRVRHLFLCDERPGCAGNPATQILSRQKLGLKKASEFLPLLTLLLQVISPDLESFTYLIYNPWFSNALSSLAAFSYPRLTCFMYQPIPAIDAKVSDKLPTTLNMPALRKVTLVARSGKYHPSWKQEFKLLHVVMNSCPRLEHVVLSDVMVNHGANALVRALVLGYTTSPEDCSSQTHQPKRKLPRIVQRVTIYPIYEGPRSIPEYHDMDAIRTLRSLQNERLDVQPVVHGRKKYRERKQEWLDLDVSQNGNIPGKIKGED
jgi:hypothetical protein